MPKEGVDNKFGFASFMLGLFSVVFFIFVIPSIIMGIVGIIFAIIQMKRSKSKLATAGLILSIIGLVAAIIVIIKIIAIFNGFYACQLNPASENCVEFSAKMGVDTQTMQCLSNPAAPGCESIIATLQNQSQVK